MVSYSSDPLEADLAPLWFRLTLRRSSLFADLVTLSLVADLVTLSLVADLVTFKLAHGARFSKWRRFWRKLVGLTTIHQSVRLAKERFQEFWLVGWAWYFFKGTRSEGRLKAPSGSRAKPWWGTRGQSPRKLLGPVFQKGVDFGVS